MKINEKVQIVLQIVFTSLVIYLVAIGLYISVTNPELTTMQVWYRLLGF